MHLDADLVGNQPHDALPVGGRQHLARIGQPLGQPVHPDPAVGVQHDLDHRWVLQQG